MAAGDELATVAAAGWALPKIQICSPSRPPADRHDPAERAYDFCNQRQRGESSGTSTLKFAYTVQLDDVVSDLQVTGLNLGAGSAIPDLAGNPLGVRLLTRNGQERPLPRSLPPPSAPLRCAPASSNGEAIMCDDNGLADFHLLV